MNRFIIVDGLPYLLVHGKTYAVRWDDKGFTVGAEVELASVPDRTYPELSIKAKCADLDSIKGAEPVTEDDSEVDTEEEVETAEESGAEPVTEDDSEVEKPLSEMTLEELKNHAKAHGIKLGSARTKDAIIEAIADAVI